MDKEPNSAESAIAQTEHGETPGPPANGNGNGKPGGPVYRESERSARIRILSIWLPLFSHSLLCLLVALLVALQVDGYKALAYDWQRRRQQNGSYVFRVSDVTTLLSVATKIIELVGDMWIGITLWRCALFLLEKPGLNLRDLSRILSGLPPFRLPRRSEWMVFVVLVCLFPQAYIEPLFSGSVNWNFAVETGASVQVRNNGANVPGDWYWYITQDESQKQFMRTASGQVSFMWADGNLAHTVTEEESPGEQAEQARNLNTLGGTMCRHITSNRAVVNSTLLDADIPCIQIHNITWPDGQFPESLEAYTDKDNDALSTNHDPPFSYYRSGNTVLFDPENPEWDTYGILYPSLDPSTYYADFPQATKFSGQMTVIVMVSRQDQNGCDPIGENSFGNASYIASAVRNVFSLGNGFDENCMTHGIVSFTAGAIRAPRSTYVTSNVVEYDPLAHLKSSRGGIEDEDVSTEDLAELIKPSIWTRDALFLMPDMMVQMAVMNSTLIPTWDNLENYTATLIRAAYMNSWDALHSSFDYNDTRTVTLEQAEQRLQASVSFARLFGWLGVTLLLPVSGILVRHMQMQRERAMIVDEVAILLTDPGEVVERNPAVTAMARLTKEDCQMGDVFLKRALSEELGFKLKFA
ncbi:hypothetical protein BJX65DRAFT_315326 [Aspergillus insuetus]